MKIKDEQGYEKALERIAELRAEGAQAETGSELAELEAAVAGYNAQAGEPAASKGRPAGHVLEE